MKKVAAMSIGCAILLVGSLLVLLAYDHRGFFAYHYDIFTSKKVASDQEELLALVQKDPREAFKRFREILTTTPLAHNTCHGIAHQMGHEAYEVFGFQKAMAYQDALCGAGFIHGIIEGRFGLLQEKDIISELPSICDLGNTSCYHGVGHGLMVATHLNIATSLTYCDALPLVGKRNCYDGVWMHIFDLEETGLHENSNPSLSPSQQAEQMITYCEQAKVAYKTSCYFYLPRIYAHATEEAFEGYADLCSAVEKAYQTTCAAGVGHALMKYHIEGPTASFTRCNGFSEEITRGACKEGGMLYYLFDKATAVPTAAVDTFSPAYCEFFKDTKEKALCKKVTRYRRSL